MSHTLLAQVRRYDLDPEEIGEKKTGAAVYKGYVCTSWVLRVYICMSFLQIYVHVTCENVCLFVCICCEAAWCGIACAPLPRLCSCMHACVHVPTYHTSTRVHAHMNQVTKTMHTAKESAPRPVRAFMHARTKNIRHSKPHSNASREQ